MTAERAFRILWGPTLENTLDFAWPVVGSMPLHWRAPRPESQIVTNGTSSVAWITGRYYRLKVTAQYFGGQQNFGATGLQAFIDWAADSNAFTLVPNILVPALTVTGCYLEGPFDALSPSLESDSTQTLDLTILHPTQDLGLAWRGLFFEYVAGGSLTDPITYTFTRASVAYEIGPDGYLHQVAAGVPADGHYPTPLSDGLQTVVLQDAVTNDIPNPEDLTNATWTKSGDVTIAANKAAAPDQAVTADQLVEGVGVTQFHAVIAPSVTIVAGDTITALGFFRSSGRYRGLFRVTDAGNANGVGVNYDLSAQTLTSAVLGAGVLAASRITQLAGGWSMIWFRGTIDPATATAYLLKVFTQDASGNNSYTGDGASGVYFWGCTAVHGVTKSVSSYVPTTGGADVLKGAYTQPPQAQWAYVKFRELGSVYVGSGGGSVWPGIWAVGCTSAVQPAWHLYETNGTGQVVVEAEDTAGNIVSMGAGAVPVIGDTVEAWALLDAFGQVSLRVSINGGAEAVAGPSGALPLGLPVAWTDPFIGLGMRRAGQRGWNGVAVFKTGPYVSIGPSAISTIAAARAV